MSVVVGSSTSCQLWLAAARHVSCGWKQHVMSVVVGSSTSCQLWLAAARHVSCGWQQHVMSVVVGSSTLRQFQYDTAQRDESHNILVQNAPNSFLQMLSITRFT
jgi:hypothetical protein